MVENAVAFVTVALAIHIAAVLIAFGAVFAYPIFFFIGGRLDKRAMPWFHRVEYIIGIWLIIPGLALVVASGCYLAAKEHQWSAFFVQWGVGVAIAVAVLGAVFFSPQEKKLAELAARDVGEALNAEVQWSPEYSRGSIRVAAMGITTMVVVLVTVYLMTVQPT
jgi:hypothetical protein